MLVSSDASKSLQQSFLCKLSMLNEPSVEESWRSPYPASLRDIEQVRQRIQVLEDHP